MNKNLPASALPPPPGLAEVPRLIANLQVEHPVSESNPLYVDLGEVRGGSPARLLANTILDAEPGRPTYQLLTGFPGSGKSTELLALQHRLETAGYYPVYLDVDSFISKSRAPESADVLLAIGAALYDQDLGASWFDQVAERLRAALQTRLVTRGLDLAVKGATGVEAAKVEASAALKVEFERYPDLFAEIRQEVEKQDVGIEAAVRRMLNSVQVGKEGKVVLLVDSLEHALSLASDIREDGEKLRRTMIEDATLRLLPVHVVYTVSPLLLPYQNAAGRAYDSDPLIVPAVSVVDADGNDSEPGICHLLELLRKRVDFAILEGGEADMRTAIRASGGYIRDLFRILRGAVRARERDTPGPIPTASLEKVIDRMASTTVAALTQENCQILLEVCEKPKELIRGEEERPLLFQLYREPLLLRYMNGGCLDIAHPLVLRSLAPDLYEHRVFHNERKGVRR